MSMKHPGRCTPRARVSLTPSKIPYVGFSPVRLQTGRRARPSSAATGLYAPQARVGNEPVRHGSESNITVQALRPVASSPEALRSAAGCSVPPPQSLLRPHLRLSEPHAALCIRRRVVPAPRGSPLYSTCVCQRAAFRTPADQAGAPGCCFPTCSSLHRFRSGSASAMLRAHRFPRGRVDEAAKFALCCGPLTGSPFTDKDFYARAFTSEVAFVRCRV